MKADPKTEANERSPSALSYNGIDRTLARILYSGYIGGEV